MRELRARQAATAQQRARANALKNIVNSMNSGFTGRPRAELSANRRAAARTRWAKVRNDVKSKKLQLLDSVSSLYDSLEKAAQFKRTTLCRMVQGIAGPAIASLIDNATKSAQFSAKLLTMTAVVCQAGLAAGLTAKAVAMGLLYGHKLACSRSTKYSDVSSAIRNKVMPAVRGPMRLVWAAAASVTTSQNVIHFSWRWYLKDWLQNTVSKQNERLAGLVDFDAVNTVLNRHVHTMYGFMMGRDVNLKPLVMDMAATLNACVVEALFDHYAGPLFMPRPEPSASCRR